MLCKDCSDWKPIGICKKTKVLKNETDTCVEMEKWHYINDLKPKEAGRYNIKTIYGNESKEVRWDGEDWLLDIGYPITHEVEMWEQRG